MYCQKEAVIPGVFLPENMRSIMFRMFSFRDKSPTLVLRKYRKSLRQGGVKNSSSSIPKIAGLLLMMFNHKVLPERGRPTMNMGLSMLDSVGRSGLPTPRVGRGGDAG